MESRIDVTEIPKFLEGKKHTHFPGTHGTQLMCADADGNVRIITPGLEMLTENAFPDGFALMTNFHLQKKLPLNNLENITCRRYRKAYGMLKNFREELSRKGTLSETEIADRAFAVLDATRQKEDAKMPTIFSMVAEPSKGLVYFRTDEDYSVRYRFSFSDNSLTMERSSGQIQETKAADCRFSGFWKRGERLEVKEDAALTL